MNPFLKLKDYLLLELERIDIYSIIIDYESYLDCVNILCKYDLNLDSKSFIISDSDIVLLSDNLLNLNRYLKNELDYLKDDELLFIFNSCLSILSIILDYYKLNRNEGIVLNNCGNCIHLIGEECGITGEEVYDYYVRNCFESRK